MFTHTRLVTRTRQEIQQEIQDTQQDARRAWDACQAQSLDDPAGVGASSRHWHAAQAYYVACQKRTALLQRYGGPHHHAQIVAIQRRSRQVARTLLLLAGGED